MNYEPDEETLKDLIILMYLRFLKQKFVWKDIPDHDPHILPIYQLTYSIDGVEKMIEIDKDWLDDSVLGDTFKRIISVDSVEV